MHSPKRYLTAKEVSEMMSVRPSTLHYFRKRKKGPPYILVEGTLIRYPYDEFERWLENQYHSTH